MPLTLILVRWLHLSTSILLASLFLFETAIVVPAARKPVSDETLPVHTASRYGAKRPADNAASVDPVKDV